MTAEVSYWTAAPDVVTTVAENGERVMLDARRGVYYTLNEVGDRLWSLLDGGASVSDAATTIAKEYGVDDCMVKSDVEALVDALSSRGLLRPGRSESGGPSSDSAPTILLKPGVLASTIACVSAVVAVTVRLRLRGFARTVARVERRAARFPRLADTPVDLLTTAVGRIQMGAALCPGVQCLERSLALYSVLRRIGANVYFRLGARPWPFAAHAWVEYRGEPINEDRDRLSAYAVFPVLGEPLRERVP